MYTLLILIPIALLILPIIAISMVSGHSSRIKVLEDQVSALKGKATITPKTEPTPIVPVESPGYSIPKAPNVTPITAVPNVSSEDKSGRLLGRIGIAAVLIGVAFFLKYAFDNNWIGPAGRVMIGIIFGLGFIGFGQYIRSKYLQYSDLLMGGGIAILYLSVFAAHSFYSLINSGTTGILMFIVTLLAFAISITNATQTLALVSVIGAFATPFLVGSHENAMWSLFGYLTIINLGVLGVSFFKKWPRQNLASFVGTAINFIAWFSAYYNADVLAPTLLFCIVTFLIFLVAQIARAIVANTKADGPDYVLMGTNAFALSITGYTILNPEYHGILGFASVIVAVIYMFFAFMVNKSNPEDKALNIFLPGLAVVFLSMAVPLQFSGAWIAVAWFIEASVLYIIASAVANRGFQVMGLIVYILGLFDFIIWYSNHSYIQEFIPFFNVTFGVLLVATISAYFISYIYHKYGSTNLEIQKRGIMFFVVVANILSIWALTVQISSYYEAKSYQLSQAHQISLDNSNLYSNGYDTSSQVSAENTAYYAEITSNKNVSNTLISVLWTLYAMVLTTIGFAQRLASVRRLGLILFIITAFKVLIDVWSLGELYRIISFIAFGVIALIASFGYIKYKDRLNKILSIAFIGFVLFGAHTSYASFSPNDWQYMRSITIPPTTSFVKALLPTDISWTSRSGQNFSDIRIIDGQGNEVPYLLNRDQKPSSPLASPNIIGLASSPDGSTRFIADMNKSGTVYSTFEINVGNNSANFRRQVSIYTSDTLLPIDDGRWSKVTGDGFIFRISDPSTGIVSGKYSVTFPANASRYFKVVIASGGEGPLQISSLSAYRDIKITNTSNSSVLPAVVNNDSVKKTTDVTIDLGAISRLSNQVELNVSPNDKNYIRRVVIQVSNDLSTWQYVGNASISRVSTPIFNGTSNSVSYGEQRARYIRLSIVNDDNPPLAVESNVTVTTPILALVFQPKTGSVYTLYYGNPKA
ncbi:MAG: DUF2339 domain-containing protein, partial [Candidatus Taylorbacteria bacterium]|nr:DUF2339 domain-containing protein [Candidatus Taylorbacteria bacterium]